MTYKLSLENIGVTIIFQEFRRTSIKLYLKDSMSMRNFTELSTGISNVFNKEEYHASHLALTIIKPNKEGLLGKLIKPVILNKLTGNKTLDLVENVSNANISNFNKYISSMYSEREFCFLRVQFSNIPELNVNLFSKNNPSSLVKAKNLYIPIPIEQRIELDHLLSFEDVYVQNRGGFVYHYD